MRFKNLHLQVEKFQEGKNLGTEILNSAQEVLYTRQVVNQLMQKCTRLAVEMERAVSQGASSITNQPKLLNPRYVSGNYHYFTNVLQCNR